MQVRHATDANALQQMPPQKRRRMRQGLHRRRLLLRVSKYAHVSVRVLQVGGYVDPRDAHDLADARIAQLGPDNVRELFLKKMIETLHTSAHAPIIRAVILAVRPE